MELMSNDTKILQFFKTHSKQIKTKKNAGEKYKNRKITSLQESRKVIKTTK